MSKIYAFLAFCLLVNVSGAQILSGQFEGALVREGSVQLIHFNFDESTFAIPEIGYYQVPLKHISMRADTLVLEFYYGKFLCFISEDGRQITGTSEGWLPKIKLHVKARSKSLPTYLTEKIAFESDDITFEGTLFNPVQCPGGKTDYVILIHGSGNQDRTTPYYISLAHQLASNGIGVLIHDKRGCGRSGGNMEDASLVDLAADANSAFHYMALRKDLHIGKLGFLGTSQGGWIAAIALRANRACDFLILNVAPAVDVFSQDMHRVEYMMRSDGYTEAAIDSALAYTKSYFQMAQKDSDAHWTELTGMIVELRNKPWSEYLNFPENRTDFGWWRANNYDPGNDLKSINCPTLCFFGALDRLVPPAENEEKMRTYLNETGEEFEIHVIPEVYHNLISAQGLNGNDWNWPKVHWQWRYQPEEYLDKLVHYIKSLNEFGRK